jgi:hypothetical protein
LHKTRPKKKPTNTHRKKKHNNNNNNRNLVYLLHLQWFFLPCSDQKTHIWGCDHPHCGGSIFLRSSSSSSLPLQKCRNPNPEDTNKQTKTAARTRPPAVIRAVPGGSLRPNIQRPGLWCRYLSSRGSDPLHKFK